jgi:hypothetical protein
MRELDEAKGLRIAQLLGTRNEGSLAAAAAKKSSENMAKDTLIFGANQGEGLRKQGAKRPKGTNELEMCWAMLCAPS